MSWVRRGLALAALCGALSGCVTPAGAEVEVCDGTWRDVLSVIETPSEGERQSVPMTCMRRVDERRVRIGFLMPPGPDCYRLAEVELEESADAAAITLWVVRDDDPLAGACPEDPGRTTTEVDLQAPIGERTLYDGSR